MAQITLNSTGVASSGALVLQSNGTTTAVTVSTAQIATFANDAVVNGLTVGRGLAAVATNTAVGASALAANTTGAGNAAFGASALISNTTASNSTAVGYQALYSYQTGGDNVAVGMQSGYNINGNGNSTFLGSRAGFSTTGGNNTFLGYFAGHYVSTGSKNTIVGTYDGNQNGLDIRTSTNNIVLSDGDGNIGMRLQYLSPNFGFFVYTVVSGAGTNAMRYHTSTGAITYDTSSARYKDNIRDSVYGLNHVMQIRSAQFEYKDDGRSDVGLIAEELQPIIPELVAINKEGQPDAVSYDRMVSVLVKAIQELKIEFDAYKATHP